MRRCRLRPDPPAPVSGAILANARAIGKCRNLNVRATHQENHLAASPSFSVTNLFTVHKPANSNASNASGRNAKGRRCVGVPIGANNAPTKAAIEPTNHNPLPDLRFRNHLTELATLIVIQIR